MILELRRNPKSDVMDSLKQNLDYASKSWLMLFDKMGGVQLIAEVRGFLELGRLLDCLQISSEGTPCCFDTGPHGVSV